MPTSMSFPNQGEILVREVPLCELGIGGITSAIPGLKVELSGLQSQFASSFGHPRKVIHEVVIQIYMIKKDI